MQAMILAAGLGARLRPLTDTKPKALIEYNGVPLLQHVLTRLISFGVTEVIINLHHFPQQIIDFLKSQNDFGIRIEFSYESTLLDTGGGLKQAAWFFDDHQPFILHNVDIISGIDFHKMLDHHRGCGALATLAVNQRQTTRYFLFDDAGRLCGWKSLKDHRTVLTSQAAGPVKELAFCGVHIISPRIFERLTEVGVFSIVDSYLRLAAAGELIQAFRVDEYEWRDVGKLEQLRR